jgi:carbonic anhydrase
MAHLCDAIIVCCIDFRFQNYIKKFTELELAGKTYDLVGFAGSTKELPTIINQIDISKRLHHIKDVYLIHHEECGAYGAESTPKRHSLDLKKARTTLVKKYPNLVIHLYYLHLDGEFEVVN